MQYLQENTTILCGAGLTFSPFALSAGPQIEQGQALVKQRVRIFHTDPVDVIYPKLQLPCQLCSDK